MKKLIITKDTVDIDLKKMPPYLLEYFLAETLWAVDRFFEQPGVKERYEEWLKTYKGRRTEDETVQNAAAGSGA